MTLADIKTGATVCIDSIDTSVKGIERLMVLGLVEGTHVSLLSAALGGDPIEVSCLGAAITLRKAQARCFVVRELNPDD